ncbi:hypothetical protein [Prescottella equi]|uniref:hypothetical protein n=1 Tax=Rhodococcus hoagii TaxID=43767 RepID=UPI000A0FEEAD|nr:hypothetical protein [Prescottella equi]ORL83925.1 hypothetical protein A5N71_01400 [Prescottella equi]
MTDTITPASLRAHADWFDTTFEPGSVEARSLRNCAARLEAESARDEEAEKCAKVHRAALAGLNYLDWDHIDDQAKAKSATAMRAVLDRLAADGRLLPEGGTVLTAEQVADIRTILPGFGGHAAAAAHARLHAFFTPPAVSVPDSGPDGTPEKPWPTWQDVPEGVVYRSTAETRPISDWVNRGGQRHAVFPSGKEQYSYRADDEMQYLAPFVRVDGDKA